MFKNIKTFFNKYQGYFLALYIIFCILTVPAMINYNAWVPFFTGLLQLFVAIRWIKSFLDLRFL